VGVRAVQEVAAAKAHYRADKAAVIASGDYTDQAVQLARSNGVELWDRARVAGELLDPASPTKSTPATVVNPPLQEEPISAASPSCPRCGSATVQRTRLYGPFWGCPDYPGCRVHARDLAPPRPRRPR
jgi:restriction system protein